MAFLDSLTSEKAREDAKTVKAAIKNQNLTPINTYFKLLIQQLGVLSYNALADLTVTRNQYEMARMVRKRNGIWKAIKELNGGYANAVTFFRNFSQTDPELVERVQMSQRVMASINRIYLNTKYRTKEVNFIQGAVGQTIGESELLADDINQFRIYFFES